MNNAELDTAIELFQECTLYFKDPSFDIKSPPHYYIILPINNESSILLTMLSSQETKIKGRLASNSQALECLIELNKGDLDILTSDKTIIDCNEFTYMSKNKFLEIEKVKIEKVKIPISLLKNIKEKILYSENCTPRIRKYLLSQDKY